MLLEVSEMLVTALEALQPTPVHDDAPHTAFTQFQLESGPPLKAFLKSHNMEFWSDGKLDGETVGRNVGEVGDLVGGLVGEFAGEVVGLAAQATAVPKLAVETLDRQEA